MARTLALPVLALFAAAPAAALADARPLAELSAVHGACRAAREGGPARIHAIDVDPGFALRAHGGELIVDTRRNLRALEGRVAIFLSGFDPIVFEADRAGAAALTEAVERGARLRLGFFLGFDEPLRQACLVRNEHAVTIVRADLAWAELVGPRGERLARAETDRWAAWQDDGASRIEGEGPRGAIGTASFETGQPPPDAWQSALGSAAARARIAQCHAEGIGRGAAAEAQVVVRLNVETRTGRVRRADVALSSLGDDDEAQCIARALGAHVQLPPGPADWRADVVDLAVPVLLTE